MKIIFHYTYLIVAMGFVLTGYFSNLIVFTSIIIVHELGHFLIAKINNLNPQKITIYPFGGITELQNLINTPIIKELVVAISGVVFQSIYFYIVFLFYKNNLIRPYIFNMFNLYHYHILLFNLLPIHPLDGSIIINLILSKFLPYKVTLKLNIIISIITSIVIISFEYYMFNYTTILIASLIIDNLIKYHKSINYLFNKFLLERYMYHIRPQGTKKISNLSHMYREKYHIIKEDSRYLTEKQVLMRRFKRNL